MAVIKNYNTSLVAMLHTRMMKNGFLVSLLTLLILSIFQDKSKSDIKPHIDIFSNETSESDLKKFSDVLLGELNRNRSCVGKALMETFEEFGGRCYWRSKNKIPTIAKSIGVCLFNSTYGNTFIQKVVKIDSCNPRRPDVHWEITEIPIDFSTLQLSKYYLRSNMKKDFVVLCHDRLRDLKCAEIINTKRGATCRNSRGGLSCNYKHRLASKKGAFSLNSFLFYKLDKTLKMKFEFARKLLGNW